MVLDCCHSGAIANIYKGGDAESALSGLAHSYGTCILTASTGIQWAEEREKDGHGVFTKALIDCLCEPLKERITVDDWYDFAFNRLKISGNQTPRIRNSREGVAIEIGNFKAKHERLRREQEEQLISTARVKLNALVASGALTELRVKTALRLLESDETTLFPYEQDRRHKLKRYLNEEVDLFDAFGNLPIAQVPPEPSPAERLVMRPEPGAPHVLVISFLLTVSSFLGFVTFAFLSDFHYIHVSMASAWPYVWITLFAGVFFRYPPYLSFLE